MNKIIKTIKKELVGKKEFRKRKELSLAMICRNEYCIAYNKKQDIPIWTFMLREDKVNIFIYDENDNIIYDGLVKDIPDYIFEYGEVFASVSFKGLNLEDNIATRENFYLLKMNNPCLKENK